jgi:amphi-Trp domain-containing protein
MEEATSQDPMTADRDVEKRLSIPEFVAELRRLADALEAGELFDIDMEGETVRVPASAIASIEHEREDGHEEIEFQLVWSAEEANEDEESAANSDSADGSEIDIKPVSEAS